jgi:NAD(P)-dependent dehydrogenase (short-subunit alcohol dehydrogenase family)
MQFNSLQHKIWAERAGIIKEDWEQLITESYEYDEDDSISKTAKDFAKNVSAKKIKNAQIINLIDKNTVRFDTSYFYYLLSKKSLAELTRMLAIELAPQIRVNGVSPGFILDPIDEKVPSDKTQSIIKKIPLQRKGDPKNIVQTIEFLLRNDFINGQIISVDGGASLNHAG